MDQNVAIDIYRDRSDGHFVVTHSSLPLLGLKSPKSTFIHLYRVAIIFLLMGSTVTLAQPQTSSASDQIKPEKTHEAAPQALQRLSSEIDQILRAQASSANLWWGSWVGIFTGFAVLNGTRATLQDETQPTKGLSKPALWTNGIKALLGTANLLVRTHSPRYAADKYESALKDPNLTPAQRVKRGEALLLEAVKVSQRRYRLTRHLIGILVNVIGGVVLYVSYDDLNGALITTALGLTSAQAHIWTQPWTAGSDLKRYRVLKNKVCADLNEHTQDVQKVCQPSYKLKAMYPSDRPFATQRRWNFAAGFGHVGLSMSF